MIVVLECWDLSAAHSFLCNNSILGSIPMQPSQLCDLPPHRLGLFPGGDTRASERPNYKTLTGSPGKQVCTFSSVITLAQAFCSFLRLCIRKHSDSQICNVVFRLWIRTTLITFHVIFLRQVLSLNLELINSPSWLANLRDLSTCLCLYQSGIRSMCSQAQLLQVCTGAGPQAIMLY